MDFCSFCLICSFWASISAGCLQSRLLAGPRPGPCSTCCVGRYSLALNKAPQQGWERLGKKKKAGKEKKNFVAFFFFSLFFFYYSPLFIEPEDLLHNVPRKEKRKRKKRSRNGTPGGGNAGPPLISWGKKGSEWGYFLFYFLFLTFSADLWDFFFFFFSTIDGRGF